MPEFGAVENGTTVAKGMTALYFEKHGVDPMQAMANAAADAPANKLLSLGAGSKITFKNGNCMQSDSGDVKLTMTPLGELKLTYKRSVSHCVRSTSVGVFVYIAHCFFQSSHM